MVVGANLEFHSGYFNFWGEELKVVWQPLVRVACGHPWIMGEKKVAVKVFLILLLFRLITDSNSSFQKEFKHIICVEKFEI